jgi:hypothetical protein
METMESLQTRFVHASRAAFRDLGDSDGAAEKRIVHRVQPGETMDSIARRYHVRTSTIAHLNRKGISRDVRVGERLLIPATATPSRVAAKPPARAAVSAPPPRHAAAPAPPARTAPDPRVERARALVDEATADYRAARFEDGLANAREAENVLRDLDDDREARKVSARAAFVAGSALAARGEDDGASKSFARVHDLDPSFEPPHGWLSPRLAKLYADSRPD